MTTEKLMKSDAEWRSELTPDQYRVLRQKGTERAFTGGLRYCINSASLDFKRGDQEKK